MYLTALLIPLARHICLSPNYPRLPKGVRLPCFAQRRQTWLRRTCSKFPGVCVFSEIYQGTSSSPYIQHSFTPSSHTCLVTGPVARFARQIAGQGYIVAAPSSYHDFTGPEPLAYDAADTDKGNTYKAQKVGVALLSSNP